MACTNCFSGCVETISDKCVKYTGSNINIPGLVINSGDPLEEVEKAITDYLATVYTGIGIVPTLEPSDICDIVHQYLPCDECGDATLIDVLTAIIKAVCAIEAEIAVERDRIDDIEAPYTDVECISDTVVGNEGTHVVLQAVITALCTAVTNIAEIYNLLSTYVKISDIDTYIQDYLSESGEVFMRDKMVPYVIYPFYPTPTVMNGAFGSQGEGLGTWAKVYLCNGNNGTPDLRGRSLIGTTSGMLGGDFDAEVNPAIAGNPAYALGDKNGTNVITLAASEIPAHAHAATATVNDSGHATTIQFQKKATSVNSVTAPSGGACPACQQYIYDDSDKCAYPILIIEGSPSSDCEVEDPTSVTTEVLSTTGISVDVDVEANTGGDAHANVHPVLATYFIMYIP